VLVLHLLFFVVKDNQLPQLRFLILIELKHKKIKKEVSYRRIIRLECYKLIKHLLEDAEYEPFKIW